MLLSCFILSLHNFYIIIIFKRLHCGPYSRISLLTKYHFARSHTNTHAWHNVPLLLDWRNRQYYEISLTFDFSCHKLTIEIFSVNTHLSLWRISTALFGWERSHSLHLVPSLILQWGLRTRKNVFQGAVLHKIHSNS